MAIIKAPDVPAPTAVLCWKESRLLTRCDRKAGHGGLCSWDHAEGGAEAPAPPAPQEKAWLLTERRKDGRMVNEAIALTNDAASAWVHSPDMEFGQARSALPLKVFPASPRAEALDRETTP